MRRFKKIKEFFNETIKIIDDSILINNQEVQKIDEEVPNFIEDKLDKLTDKMSNFYDEIKFPNYDDLEDYASLYDKGRKQIFTRKLDEELSYSSNILELGCGTGQLSLFLARGNREICGVDISDSSLRMGEKFRKENNI